MENKQTSIEELERELYRRQARPSFPEKKEEEIKTGPTEPLKMSEEGSWSSFSRRRFTWLLVLVIIAASTLAAFIFWRGFFAFTKNKVDIEISAPENIIAGEEVSWLVKIRNNNNSSLENGELIFLFPKNSLDTSNGTLVNRTTRTIDFLESGQSHEEEFTAIVIGGDNFEKSARAVFRFQPKESSLVLEEENRHILIVEKFPVIEEIQGPEETLSGQSIDIFFKVFNDSQSTFNNLRLRIEYPSGFRFESSDKTLEVFNTIWPIGQLLPTEERENKITGEVTGLEGEGKIFRAFLEYREPSGWKIYKETSLRSDLAVLPLALSVQLEQEENNSVFLGKELTYELSWRNNFDIPLSALTLKAILTGELFNMSTLKTSGSIDARNSTITWGSSQLSSLGVLRPGERGVVTFRITTDSSFPLSLTNPTLTLRGEIESETKPAGLTVDKVRAISTQETKVNGNIELDSFAYHNELSGFMVNTGPYPLKVGELTTFTVHWKLASFANIFDDVRIKAILPSGIQWQDETHIKSFLGSISYDTFSREVVWEISRLEANQGRLLPIEAIFKIGVRPVSAQIGDVIALPSETEIFSQDSFTNNNLNFILDEINSRIPNDPAGGGFPGRVQE